jgi:phosphatidylglycerophosphatase A
MMQLHKLVATFFGIGYIGKGGGTVAAVAFCIIWMLIPESILTMVAQVFILLLVLVTGVWSGNAVDPIWGKDSSKVVIDEVAGMLITVIFLPIKLPYILTGLVLFRIFDIGKPLFIRKMEFFPKGWGVMADDVLAGIYAHIVLQLIILFQLF